MKLTTLLLIVTLTQVSASVFSQQITLNEKRAPLEKVLDIIKKQSGYQIFYQDQDLLKATPVTIQATNASLQQVLDETFANQPLSYKIFDKTVVIKEKEPTLIEKAKAFFAQVTITGKVTDESGQPLAGVTIKIKTTGQATATDAKGIYTITVPDNNTILVFTYIGFESQELKASDIPNGSVITMKAIATNLHEVFVNKGYYKERQELSTGNVSKVTAQEIGEQPVSDPILALEGRVPGLQITQSTGTPGKLNSIAIRGKNSAIQGANPLFVVDGVPFFVFPTLATSFDNPNISPTVDGLSSPFNSINPQDIESIEVLKDADATAIYGSRGANGVILITTKKGKAGATRADVSFYTGWGDPTRTLKRLNTDQYLKMRNEAFVNDGTNPPANAYDINGTWDVTRNTDWTKEFLTTSHFTDAEASVSGGNVNTQFLIGGGYHKETPIIPGNFFDQRGSVHTNITHRSTDDRFNVSFSAYYSSDDSQLSLGMGNLTTPPDAPPIYNENGTLNWANSTWTNPFRYTLTTGKGVTNLLNSNVDLSYKIINDLQFKVNLGYTNTQMNQFQADPITYYDPAIVSSQSFSASANSLASSWIVEPQINYRKAILKGTLEALLGTSFQSQTLTQSAIQGFGYSNDALLQNIAAATTVQYLGNSYSNYKYNSVYGRVGYNWQEKYIINLTGRRDGSSRFGSGKQWGNFGAVGAGWIFSKEAFVENNLPWLSFGKLRASYGITGNDQIGDYKYLTTYNPYTTGTYFGGSTLMPTGLANPEFGWETTKKTEVGAEFGFLKDRISFTTSYYSNESSNLLLNYLLPSFTGSTSVVGNFPATIKNSGLEFTLNTINVKSKDFSWTTSFNLTIPIDQATLISFPGLATSSYATKYIIGQTINISKFYHFTGVDPQTGLYTFQDYDNDGKISSPNDNQVIISKNKQYYGGIQNNLKYKNWQLDFFFQFVAQKYGQNLFSSTTLLGSMANIPEYLYNNRWKAPGDNATVQKLSNSNSSATSALYSIAASDYAYSNASFIRLKNLSISYQIPGNWKRSLGLTNCRLFIQGQNLLTVTKYLGADPETQTPNGIPPVRVLTVGIQVGL